MITIVSGLPRCGTSLMMRMLELGGLPVLVDGIRAPDEDNPRGYYELEAVKKVKADPSFLAGAEGRVVKMVSRLLHDLPADRRYRVVFMRREMAEMIASQNKMLQRLGKPLAPDDGAVERLFQRHIDDIQAWLSRQAHIETLYVSYNRLVADPEPEIAAICRFLGDARLDAGRMRGAIDVKLHRQRAAPGT